VEAINYLTKGLELLKVLPDTSERAQQELTLQITLGTPLIATKGYAAPDVESMYSRARELCRQVGETPQLFPVMWGLWAFYTARAEHREGYELAQQCVTLARRIQDAEFLLESDVALGTTLFWRGEFVPSRTYLEHGVTLYSPEQYRSHTFLYGQDPGVWCHCFLASLFWVLGYPDQALKKSQEALALAQEVNHPPTLAFALLVLSVVHLFRGEWELAREPTEALLVLATEQGFPYWLAEGTGLQGSMSVAQGRVWEGIEQQRQSMATLQAIGTELNRPGRLYDLAAAYGKVGQEEEGLQLLAEALALVNKTGGRSPEAELYRIKGELLIQQHILVGIAHQNVNLIEAGTVGGAHPTEKEEAEACFLKAIDVARKQQAKSLELRASTSLARLWQQQGKTKEAHRMLSEVYNWFTEGFDTKDLQEAKALLDSLASGV
jgi:predicted ATPase